MQFLKIEIIKALFLFGLTHLLLIVRGIYLMQWEPLNRTTGTILDSTQGLTERLEIQPMIFQPILFSQIPGIFPLWFGEIQLRMPAFMSTVSCLHTVIRTINCTAILEKQI